jgi:phosphate transport system substrate-binding protein
MMRANVRVIITFLLFSMLLSLVAGCAPKLAESSQTELKGTITVSGAFALYPMMNRWAEEFHKLHPGVEFDVSAGGAGKGMADALAGAVDIGMVSRDISADEEAKGAFWIPVVKDAVFPTVNAQNPVMQDLMAQGITKDTFIGIYITGEIKTWGQVVGKPEITDEIHVYTRSDAAGAPETWAKYLGNKKQENLLGIGVFGDPGLVDAVTKDPLGIGYNNLGYAYDNTTGTAVAGSAVVPIDANENGKADPEEVLTTKKAAVEAVAAGKYPSPPARLLNLVTKGKPTGLVLAFFQWVLDEGQNYASEAGYVGLTPEQKETATQKLR